METQAWLNHAEDNRREKPSSKLSNLSFTEGERIIDYAEPLAHATLALSHLTEGIAGRQLERSLAALVALDQSLEALKAWMAQSGYLEATQQAAEADCEQT